MQSEHGFLHFLRTFPIWLITVPLYFINELLYLYFQDPFLKTLTEKSFDALLLSIGIRIAQPPTNQQENKADGNMTVINPPDNQTDLENITPTEIENAVENLEKKEK